MRQPNLRWVSAPISALLAGLLVGISAFAAEPADNAPPRTQPALRASVTIDPSARTAIDVLSALAGQVPNPINIEVVAPRSADVGLRKCPVDSAGLRNSHTLGEVLEKLKLAVPGFSYTCGADQTTNVIIWDKAVPDNPLDTALPASQEMALSFAEVLAWLGTQNRDLRFAIVQDYPPPDAKVTLRVREGQTAREIINIAARAVGRSWYADVYEADKSPTASMPVAPNTMVYRPSRITLVLSRRDFPTTGPAPRPATAPDMGHKAQE